MKHHILYGTHQTIQMIQSGASIDQIARGHYELVTFSPTDHPHRILDPLIRWDGYAILPEVVYRALADYGLQEAVVI